MGKFLRLLGTLSLFRGDFLPLSKDSSHLCPLPFISLTSWHSWQLGKFKSVLLLAFVVLESLYGFNIHIV